MLKFQYFLILVISIGTALSIYSKPSEAATNTNSEVMNGKEISKNISSKLKDLQAEVTQLNEEKDKLNQKVKELYPKKKRALINQLELLEKNSYSKENQEKLNKIQNEINKYKVFISKNNELKSERKKLWAKYKRQMEAENLKGAYQTLKLIRNNLVNTITNSKEFLNYLKV